MLFYYVKLLKIVFKPCKILVALILEDVILLVRWVAVLKESKIILDLPTKYDHVEIFEQTVTGGFSSVNTRLVFDSQILLPNLTKNIDWEKNPMNQGFNYKIAYNLKIENEKTEKRELLARFLNLMKIISMVMEWQNHYLLVV